MTAEQIAEIVGTKYKPWFPSLVYSESDQCYIDEATGRVVSPDIAELAFIGAAVRELARRNHTITVNDSTSSGARAYNEEMYYVGTSRYRGFFGKCLLAALVAALNESEGK